MRHTLVARAVMLLGGTLAAGTIGFTTLVRDRPPTPSAPIPAHGPPAVPGGAAVFARRCGTCHTDLDLRGQLNARPGERPAVEPFLRGHTDASDDENRDVLDFLSAEP
mgnify:CR=1 FL=1